MSSDKVYKPPIQHSYIHFEVNTVCMCIHRYIVSNRMKLLRKQCEMHTALSEQGLSLLLPSDLVLLLGED